MTCSTYLAQRNGKVLSRYFWASWKLESSLFLIKQYGVSHEVQIILRTSHMTSLWKLNLDIPNTLETPEKSCYGFLCPYLSFLWSTILYWGCFFPRFWAFFKSCWVLLEQLNPIWGELTLLLSLKFLLVSLVSVCSVSLKYEFYVQI